MIFMPGNNGSGVVHYLAGKYPGTLGWIMSPGSFKEPRAWLPYALDNGAYAAWEAKREWRESDFFDLLDRCRLSRYKPIWVAVPDAIGDKERTLWLWRQYERRVRMYGWPVAFVVQDGMTPADVPKSAELIFVGGTTRWKWRNVPLFCASFRRVHVGRVNWIHKLEFCERVGAESCDGNGFFRDGPDSHRVQQVVDFVTGHRRYAAQHQLDFSTRVA